MGHRTVKRVPLDFDWPLKAAWQGFLLPQPLRETDCEACDGRGWTAARRWIGDIAHLILLLNSDLRSQQRGEPMHPYLRDIGSRAFGTRPSPDIAELAIGLAGRGEPGRWHDAIDGWTTVKKLIEAAGLDPNTWGICPVCKGHGSTERYEGQRGDAEAWRPTEPPTGEGWQLWETTSEGSPVSPVFATAEALADWCQDHATWFADQRWSRDEWLRSFVDETTDVDSLVMFRA